MFRHQFRVGLLQNLKNGKLDALKAWNMAQTCYSKDVLELDKADFMALQETINAEPQPYMIKGQLMEFFAETKDVCEDF